MSSVIYDFQRPTAAAALLLAAVWLKSSSQTLAQDIATDTTTNVYLIDLPTALQLAGAQNLDVQLARQKLDEARANNDSALLQFFPWLATGITYHRHDDLIQDTGGNILEVHKQSYAPGGALVGQLDLGNAIYQKLAAKQLQRAADHALQAQRQESVAAAAQGYFDLAFAKAAVGVSEQAVQIATNYEAQLRHALDAGLAFKGDLLRVSVEAEHNRLALRQAVEQREVAAARLAQTLHLDPAVELVPRDVNLEPLALFETNASLKSLVQQAASLRPELKQTQALIEAARADKNGVVYGPLVPSIVGQAFVGGLGGGTGSQWGNFGDQQDYFVGVRWRCGPGGVFDFGRQRAAKARLSSARTTLDKVHDDVVRQVVEAFARARSQYDQIATSKRALVAAEEGLRLAQQRQEFGVGIVLENIVAQQDLTRARNDYLKAVAEFNKAQYGLSKAIGTLQSSQ